MPVFCAAYGCNNRRSIESKSRGITFHKFPSNIDLRRQWEVAMKREGFVASKSSKLCSEHFKPHDFDRTGQIVRLRDGATPSLFNFPSHHQRSVATTNTKTSGKAEESLPVDLSQHFSESGPQTSDDHSYALHDSPTHLKARLSEALGRVECLEHREKIREQRAKKTVKSFLEDLNKKNLINDELKEKLDFQSGWKIYMMTFLESRVFSILETLVEATVNSMARAADESLLMKFKEKHSLNQPAEIKLNAVLEMHVKEAVEKVCGLFSDNSAVLHVPLTENQTTHDNLKRKPKRLAKRHKSVTSRKRGCKEIPNSRQIDKAPEEITAVGSQSCREEKSGDIDQPESLVASLSTAQQSNRMGNLMLITEENPEQSHENAMDDGKSQTNDEQNKEMFSRGLVDVSSVSVGTEGNAVTALPNVIEVRCIKTQRVCCKDCKRTFSKLSHLRAHQALHAAVQKPFSCSQCGKSFTRKRGLDAHQTLHAGGTLIHQQHLRNRKRFCSSSRSLQKRSGKKQHSCETCGKFFACGSNLYRHRRIHTGEKPFTCRTCGKSFNQLNTLKSHERIHTGEKPYVCKSCGKEFSQANGLRLHNGRAAGKEGFSCVVCGLGSACVNALKLHHRTHNAELSVLCRICGESIASLSSLQAHQSQHCANWSYACGICEKTFRSSGSLKIHERTHTGEKPYSCNVCGRTFTQQTSLKSHQLSHTGERPFSCEVCAKGFSSLGNLRRHQRIHTGQKPYSCTVCERSFTQHNTLKAHMYVHTGEKQYTCEKCGRSFGYQRNLKSHNCEYNE